MQWLVLPAVSGFWLSLQMPFTCSLLTSCASYKPSPLAASLMLNPCLFLFSTNETTPSRTARKLTPLCVSFFNALLISTLLVPRFYLEVRTLAPGQARLLLKSLLTSPDTQLLLMLHRPELCRSFQHVKLRRLYIV